MTAVTSKNKVYKLLKFVGRKGVAWFAVSVTAAISMAGVEIALSIAFALLIRSLGITAESPILPFGLNKMAISRSFFVAALIGIGVLRSTLQFLVTQSMTFSTGVMELRLKQILLLKYFKSAKFEGSQAEFNFYLDTFAEANGFMGALLSTLPALIQAVILFTILIYKNYELTLIGFIGVVFSALFLSQFSKRIVNLGTIIRNHSLAWNKRIVRSIRNWSMLRALRLTDIEHRYIADNQFTQIGLTIRATFFGNILAALPQFLGILVATGLIALQLKHPKISGIEFIGYLYLFLRFVQCLGTASSYLGMLSNNYSHFIGAIRFFFSFTPDQIAAAVANVNLLRFTGSNWRTVGAEAMFPNKEQKLQRPTGIRAPEIRIDKISFGYGTEKSILSDLSLVVPPSGSLAIVGPSGSGKSTLLSIILGVNDPRSGSVTIDKLSPEEYFQKNPYSVGYVVADPYLIEGSIRDNLIYGNPFDLTEAMLVDALRSASLEDLINSLPGGLNYTITENGEGLSTGQKQRLSLARAFLRNPALLVLDEISANLDLATEAEIAKTLRQMNYQATILIVSHRIGLVEHITNRIDLGAI